GDHTARENQRVSSRLAYRWRQRRRCDRGSAIAVRTDRAGWHDIGRSGRRRRTCRSRLRAGIGDMLRRLARPYDNARANLNAAVEILDVFVEKTDATGRYERTNRRRLVCAVDSIERTAEIERTRSKRVAGATRHHARQIRLTFNHLRRREPVR